MELVRNHFGVVSNDNWPELTSTRKLPISKTIASSVSAAYIEEARVHGSFSGADASEHSSHYFVNRVRHAVFDLLVVTFFLPR
jgi:hypothetical protein